MTSPSMVGAQILVVEDSTTQAEQLATMLEAHGHQVVIAGDGMQALGAIERQHPDLIISDVVMPNLGGYELSKAIKNHPHTRHIPLILVTTLANPIDVIRGLESGADNFIRKPIDQRYLLARIDYLLMNRTLREHEISQLGVEIELRGQRHFINSDRRQILDLLISTYEQAVDLNHELTQQQQELARSNEVLDSLYRIAEDLNNAVTPKEVFEKAIDRLVELPDVQAAWITLVDASGENPKVIVARNLPGMEQLDTQSPIKQCQCLQEVVRRHSRSAFNVHDCARLETFESVLPGISSHATVPLFLSQGDKVVLANLVAPDEFGFDDGQLQLFATIGKQIVVALERAQMHENLEALVTERTMQVRRLNRLYSLLSGINNTIVRTRTNEALFNGVCRIAIEKGGFKFAWIGPLDNGLVDLSRVAWASSDAQTYAPDQIAHAVAGLQQSGLLDDAFANGEPLVFNDVRTEQRMGNLWQKNFQSIAILPLYREQNPAGACVFYAAEPEVFSENNEVAILNEIAGDIGFALAYQEKESRLNYLAYYDSVTDAPNRAFFMERLQQNLYQAEQHNYCVGIVLLNLNRFKIINDSLGHSTGNLLLKEVAKRLTANVSEKDLVAHLTGDEFGLIFPDLECQENYSDLAAKVLDSFSQSFHINKHELFISAGLGVAMYPSNGHSTEILVRNAEAAMHRAKADGGNSYLLYSAAMTEKARELLDLESDFRRGLERQEFLLHYQPIIDTSNGAIIGVETLVRWLSPERGLVSPAKFIPLAEETLLIIELGAWVLSAATEQHTQGWGESAGELRLAVNVSTRQFLQPNFYAMVAGAIERAGINPSLITLEITESHLMENIDDMVAVMYQLGELGVRFSIDDFGTGYSSLAYLKSLPIANLKIDQSFVKGLPDNSDDVAIVKTIISMAHSLNLSVVAEGVETKEQLEFLRAHGCEYVQGYYFSRPVPADDLALLLVNGLAIGQ
jgi:diguanylate cyclase (GGDEF)-like protein